MPVVTMGGEEFETPPRNGTTATRRMREEEDLDLKSQIDALGGEQDIVVKVHRIEPREWRHKGERLQLGGLIATYTEIPTDAQLEDAFGGGTYQVKVNRTNGQYFASKTIRIAGRPKIDAYVDDEPAAPTMIVPPQEDSALASQAMKTLKDLVDKGSGQSAFNPELINTFMAPLMAQIQSMNAANVELQKQIAEKEARMLEILTQKPDTSKEDNLLREVWNSDSRRLESIREAHQSEMRIIREHHEAALARLDDRHKDDIKALQRSHEREIDSIKDSSKQAVEALKLAYESRIDGFKSDVSRLERELTESKSEIGSLRSIKEKSLVEQATELAQVGDALKAIGIGGSKDDDEDNSKWYEKLANVVVENPEAIAQLIGGPNAGPQPQMQQPQMQQPQMQMQQPQLPPVGQPFRGPDGEVYVRVDEQGNVLPLEQARQRAQQLMTQKEAQEKAARAPDPKEVAIAIRFIEAAYTNHTDPETFANTARASIPADILHYIEEQGVENFLNNVAKLDTNSPLRNVAGRKYMRTVGNFLLKGQAD